MKKSTTNKLVINRNRPAEIIFYLIFCCAILLLLACNKSDQNDSEPAKQPALSLQEQTLIGKWNLKKTETYEITGIDSAGQYVGALIGSYPCDSTCILNFKNEYSSPLYNQQLKGLGSIGGCDSTETFLWKAKQPGKVETGDGKMYTIAYLSFDSAAFSFIYTKDILQLKSVMYYKRK